MYGYICVCVYTYIYISIWSVQRNAGLCFCSEIRVLRDSGPQYAIFYRYILISNNTKLNFDSNRPMIGMHLMGKGILRYQWRNDMG